MDTLTQKPHPFDIPEVLFLIARYLKAKHLVAFSHVCKSFRAWLAPLLWKNVELGRPPGYRRRTNREPMAMIALFPPWANVGQSPKDDPLQQALQANASWIRSLADILGQPPVAIGTEYSSLCSLTLSSCRIESESMCHFWSISQQLESLEIRNTFLSLPTGSPPVRTWNGNNESNQDICAAYEATTSDARFPKLRKLIVDDVRNCTPLEQLEWLIKPCPLLETLNWDTGGYLIPGDEFSDSFASMTWPNLVSITISDSWRRSVSDENYMTILRTAKKPLKSLDMTIARLGRPAFDLILKHHFETITEIDLTKAQDPNQDWKTFVPEHCSLWVREVLESCYSLERLVASIISSDDIINGKPWVCRRLKCLQVVINMNFKDKPTERGRKRPKFTEDEERVCRGVFGQLSRLISLKSLELSGLLPSEAKIFALPLELRLGLGQLSQLKNIDSIRFHGNQDMRMTDIQWMMDHWPRLQCVDGDILSTKRSRTFENLFVRDYLLCQALWKREIRPPHLVGLERAAAGGDVYDSDSECDSDEIGLCLPNTC
ncbi:hypothetical protein B0O80DRAFT_527445 [Mortierella sp. GBAus27b]|nr:hypothetical protein B0O80DRAFT_527445 [Mortierella sp. GBAus27b]